MWGSYSQSLTESVDESVDGSGVKVICFVCGELLNIMRQYLDWMTDKQMDRVSEVG